mgnify:CR=1 FL=1
MWLFTVLIMQHDLGLQTLASCSFCQRPQPTPADELRAGHAMLDLVLGAVKVAAKMNVRNGGSWA